ncbi:uncharacterized protein LOC133928751 isoform X1 [Phragmites australis]|uniref:uncharacterized protein LOC133928751 isoform X1 n=1 Tax=Phragmites australis TaxID=29695 RepID=UPI002D775394|nr:uncharacterized protein LOC133928751 isoform X1 [Phragmites australis]
MRRGSSTSSRAPPSFPSRAPKWGTSRPCCSPTPSRSTTSRKSCDFGVMLITLKSRPWVESTIKLYVNWVATMFRWRLYKKASQVLYLHFALKRREFLEEFHEKQEQVLLLSRAQRKQAEKSIVRARSAQAQIDLLQKRAEKAEGQKREMSRRAKDAELRLERLEMELDALRSVKGIADSEVSCLRQNLQSFEAQVCELQSLCASEREKAERLQIELSEANAYNDDALNVIGELKLKAVAACEAISRTFEGIGASATPPSLELVGLSGLIGWINETSSSLLLAAQLYGNFCAMVAARSLVQSMEMTGCDHHTALQQPSFQYPSDLSTSAITKASKSTARSFTTNYRCKHGRELALREAELNRQRV